MQQFTMLMYWRFFFVCFFTSGTIKNDKDKCLHATGYGLARTWEIILSPPRHFWSQAILFLCQTRQVKEKPALCVHACTFLNSPPSSCLWLSCQDAERYASGHHLRVERRWHAVIGLWATQAFFFFHLFIVYFPRAWEILFTSFHLITKWQLPAAARNN